MPAEPKPIYKFVRLKHAEFSRLKKAYSGWHPKATEEHISELKKAFDFMRQKHRGQMRKGGEHYEIHPFNVAYYAARAGCEHHEVIAALLHDVVEDTGTSIREIRGHFGVKVARIVSLLSTPKVRIIEEKPGSRYTAFIVESVKEGTTLNAHLVLPEHPEYARAETDEEKKRKDHFKEQVLDMQEHRLFMKESPIDPHNIIEQSMGLTNAHWSAIKIKMLDGLYNLADMGPFSEEKRQQYIQKTGRFSRWLFSRFHPAFDRSVPQDARSKQKIFLGIKRLAPRNWMRHEDLLELPAATDLAIHVHDIENNEHAFEVKFPRVHFGKSQTDRLHLDRMLRTIPGAQVTPAHSKIPPGLDSFWVFRVALPKKVENPFQTLRASLSKAMSSVMKRRLKEALGIDDEKLRELLEKKKRQPIG